MVCRDARFCGRGKKHCSDDVSFSYTRGKWTGKMRESLWLNTSCVLLILVQADCCSTSSVTGATQHYASSTTIHVLCSVTLSEFERAVCASRGDAVIPTLTTPRPSLSHTRCSHAGVSVSTTATGLIAHPLFNSSINMHMATARPLVALPHCTLHPIKMLFP